MSSYLFLFLFLFGIVDSALVDFAVDLPGFGVVVAERDGQRDAARILGVEGENVAGARRGGFERLLGERDFGTVIGSGLALTACRLP